MNQSNFIPPEEYKYLSKFSLEVALVLLQKSWKNFLSNSSVWWLVELMLQSIQHFCPDLEAAVSSLDEDWKVLYVTFLDVAAKNNAGVRQGDQNDFWSWAPHSLISSLHQHNSVKFINKDENGSVVFSWAVFAELRTIGLHPSPVFKLCLQ